MLDGVTSERELIAKVDAAFAVTGQALAGWSDPHPDRSPLDDEYSRLSDPAKWRIIGARADAWIAALVEAGLAVVDVHAGIRWQTPPAPVISRTTRVVPKVTDALPLSVARSQLGPLDDAGVVLGAGDPAVCVVFVPDCGCDACDSGSQDVLDELDEHILGVVSGAFRRLARGDREITVIGDRGWRATGSFGRGEVETILAAPTGWRELSGPSWLVVDG